MSVAAFACAISQALSAQQSARVLKSVCERVQTCASMSFPKRAVRCSSRRAADCEPEHSQQGSVMPMWAVWTVRAISQCASVSEHDNCGARIITFKQMRSLAAPREQRVCWSGFRRTLRPCSNRMQQASAELKTRALWNERSLVIAKHSIFGLVDFGSLSLVVFCTLAVLG